ncbi:MAG: CRISPR-associated protein Csx18 [Elainellaceae cyanobacterium]
MYLTPRAAFVRNLSVAIVNGAVTYILLIIAPLGLMAVFINTILVAIASFATASASDRIILFLMGDQGRAEMLGRQSSQIQSQNMDELDRR